MSAWQHRAFVMGPHVANDLSNNVLIIVLQSLRNDYHSLSQCALVNHTFYQAASKLLYRKVVLSPRYALIPSQDGGSDYSNLKSATLPSYARFVEIIEISRYLSCRPPPANTLSKTILDAITQFKNLRVAIFTPITFHEDVFTDVFKYLGGSNPSSVDDSEIYLPTAGIPPILRELVVNTSCTDEVRAPLLIQITGLSKLSIHSPTRAILQLLSDWLRRLSDTLTELHLKDNCGSVTPGVLRSFMPLLERNIQSLSIGLSYSLTEEDIFSVLHHFQNLRKLELRYYWQLRQPRTLPRLERLRSFTGYHINYQTRFQVRSLCKWIRRAITSSPIESLHLIQNDPDQQLPEFLDSSSSSSFDLDNDITISNNTGANISFRSLIDHICSCHSKTLKILDMKTEYIDIKSLKKLIGCCSELEEMHVCAGRHSLSVFKKHSPSSLHKLHTASFNIRNIRLSKRRVIDMELVTAIMRHGPPLLRRLTVNGQFWESSWKTTESDHTYALHIHKHNQPNPPWNKKYIDPPPPSSSPPPPPPPPSSSSEEEEQTKTQPRSQPGTYPHPPTKHFSTTTTVPPPPPLTASRPEKTTSILTTTSSPIKNNIGGGGFHVRFSEPKEFK